MGLHREAYRLVVPDEWKFSKAKTDLEYQNRLLWCARLVNLQGASLYALRIIEQIDSNTLIFHKTAAQIYLTHFKSKEALHHFEQYLKNLKQDRDMDYENRVLKVSYADALMGSGQGSKALQVLDKIPVHENECLLMGIVQQARGEYFARLGRYQEALIELEKAEMNIPKTDESTDRAFLKKWHAYVLAKLGKKEESLVMFEEALNRLKKPDLRPEVWLDCYRILHELGLLKLEDQEIFFTYPGAPRYFNAVEKESPELIMNVMNKLCFNKTSETVKLDGNFISIYNEKDNRFHYYVHRLKGIL